MQIILRRALVLLALLTPFPSAWAEYTNVPALQAPISIRQKLTSPGTLYVRKDGSDTCSGLVDAANGPSGACAKLTIQAAINVARDNIDASGFNVIVQVRAGTYNEDVNLFPIVGILPGGQAILRGDTATPSNVVLNGTSISLKATGVMPDWLVEGFKFTSAGDCINAHAQAWLRVGVVEFGACAISQAIADQGATLELQGSYTISAGAAIHVNAQSGGRILQAFTTTTLIGSLAFTVFANADLGGAIDWQGSAPTGPAATGIPYVATESSRISIPSGPAIATFFPGNAGGVVSKGGTISGVTANSGFDATTVTTLNGNTITPGTGTLTIGAGKTLTASNSLTFTGIDGSAIPFGAWTTYTPTLTPGAGTYTSASAAGAYSAHGKQVSFRIVITITTNGTASGFITVTLPSNALALTVLAVQNTSTTIAGSARVGAGSNVVILNRYDNTYFGADGNVIVVSGVYESQ